MSNPQPYVRKSDLECEQIRDELHSFLMNELTQKEAKVVGDHLVSCEACRKALREHVELFGMLREHSDVLARLLDTPKPRKDSSN